MNDEPTPTDLAAVVAEVRRLDGEATRGPFTADGYGDRHDGGSTQMHAHFRGSVRGADGQPVVSWCSFLGVQGSTPQEAQANACLFAYYRTAAPLIAAEVERQAARLRELEGENAQLRAERDKLQVFKDYVHKRLDDAGVEKDPESSHKLEGCRIGGRLDIVLGELSRRRAGEDGTAVTPEWLKEVGFVEQEGHLTAISPNRDDDGLIVRRLSSGEWNAEDGFTALLIPTPKTRGDVVRLCEALGVPVGGERTTKGGGGA